MNILFIVAYTPTPVRTRPYNLLRTLVRRGHAVSLATLWENDQEYGALKQLENEGVSVIAARLTKLRSAWNCLRVLPNGSPLQSVYCWQPQLLRLLNMLFEDSSSKFDIVHVEHLRGAQYGLALKSLSILHPPRGPLGPSSFIPPIVWDSVDCISFLFEQAAHNSRSGFGRLVTRFELPRTKKHEAWLVNQFDHILVTSPIDRKALEALYSKAAARNSPFQNPKSPAADHCSRIIVLPNGVDLDFFSPSDALREPATIVFSGKMSYHANVTAALHLVDDIMPHVWEERPNVRIQIVGQDPPSQIRKLATRHPARVTVTGRVPDLRPYLQRATLGVAPMSYGAGIQNKVLEAMACATPVVATSPAISALQASPGEHVLTADEPAEFARQVLRLLDDQGLQRRIGQAGRCYVEEQHNWDRIVERLENVYCELVAQPASGVVMRAPSSAVFSSNAREVG